MQQAAAVAVPAELVILVEHMVVDIQQQVLADLVLLHRIQVHR
jgi:hypothetical protein